MQKTIQRIWNDPVGSQIISTAIIFVLGVIGSFIWSLINNKTVLEALQSILVCKINIWLALGLFLTILVIVSMLKRRRVPPFVKEFNKGQYQNQTWKWHWQRKGKVYHVTDLSIVCPMCHKGLLTLGYMNYRCAKCNADLPYRFMNTTSDAVEKQILDDTRQKYGDYANCIGGISEV